MCCPCGDACSQDRENSHFFRGLSVRSASLKCWMDRRGAALDPRKWHVVYSKHYELKHGKKKKSYDLVIFFRQIEIILKDYTAFVYVTKGILSRHLGKTT